ncbi:hypothetical protein KFE25_007829 [Diacronema lutheri]|uniref:Uncharacterized protein n=2 Tax=Diacronema lutheri TaxID=2081491 RepID=A0A8J6CFN8_DIALT|nr:hypothetical protein KFE25_007829 [Diacronema lutheri]
MGALAPDWVPVKDQSSGDTYYWNQLTNETTWDRPVASEPLADSLPALRRTSAARSVNVAPGAAAAAAARTRGLARSGSMVNSPTCSQQSTASAGAGDPPPLRSPLGPAAGANVCATSAAAVSPAASSRRAQPTGAATSGGGHASPPAVSIAPLVVPASAVQRCASSDALSASDGELSAGARTPSALGDRWLAAAVGAEAYVDEATGETRLRPSSRTTSRATSPSGRTDARRFSSPHGATAGRGHRISDPPSARAAAAAQATSTPARSGTGGVRAAAAVGGAAAPSAATSGCSLEVGFGKFLSSLSGAAAGAGAGAAAAAAAGVGGVSGARAKLLAPNVQDSACAAGGAGGRAGAAGSRDAPKRQQQQPPLLLALGAYGALSRPAVLGALALAACILLVIVAIASGGAGARGGRSRGGPHTAVAPRVVYVGQHVAQLEWAQPAPSGAFAALYEVELLRGARGGSPIASYAGLASARSFDQLPERAELCARARLALREEGSGAALPSAWSSCRALRTSGPAAPQPPELAPLATSIDTLSVAWLPPEPNGASLVSYELQHSVWRFDEVDSCAWTGPTCALGCAPLGAAGPANASWVQSSARLAAVWERCTGANAVGCCGPFCWCYDRYCCRLSREFAEVPFAATRTLPAGAADSLVRAELDVSTAGASHTFSARARARNAHGWSAWSRALRLSTDAVGARAPAPLEPPLFATGASSALFSWAPPDASGADIVGYEVQLHEASARAGLPPAAQAVAAHDATEAVVEGLSPDTRYHAVVRARNSKGATPWTEAVALVSRELRPPRAPAQLSAQLRYTDALGLEWQAVHEETASVVGYELEWARATQASAHGAWQRACTVGDVDGELGPFALHAPRTSAALNELRDALRAPRCTASALPQHARLLVRARTRSLAGWGPWSAPTSAQTLDVKPCGALADQARIWGAAFNNELQTCSADCWGQPQCTVHCLQGINLSGQCARCFGAAVSCTKTDCHSACGWSPTSDGCRECAARNCWPNLSSCAGSAIPGDVL